MVETFAVRRIERDVLDNREGTMVEYAADARVMGLQFPIRGRLYFFSPGERLYVVSYLADEGTFARQRSLFEAIVQSFEVNQ